MYTIDISTGEEIFEPVNARTFSEGENEIDAEEDNETDED